MKGKRPFFAPDRLNLAKRVDIFDINRYDVRHKEKCAIMSPVDLPGGPLEPPKSQKIIKCPRCNKIHFGANVVKVLKLQAIKDIVVTCKVCGCKIKLKKHKKK